MGSKPIFPQLDEEIIKTQKIQTEILYKQSIFNALLAVATLMLAMTSSMLLFIQLFNLGYTNSFIFVVFFSVAMLLFLILFFFIFYKIIGKIFNIFNYKKG